MHVTTCFVIVTIHDATGFCVDQGSNFV